MHIGKRANPFHMIKDIVHTIKIINNKEFEALDLNVIRGTFGKWIGLNINKPRMQTKIIPILESP